MIERRASESRGQADYGWLRTFHSFSFGDYFDPQKMGFGDLRVINEDFISPSTGFPLHGHRDMEIVTYLIKGQIQHADSMGNQGVISEGEIQWMSAGSGIRHSEVNPSADNPTHLLQIWIEPTQQGLSPQYEKMNVHDRVISGRLTRIIGGDGESPTLQIHQVAAVYVQKTTAGFLEHFDILPSQRVWIQMIEGDLKVATELSGQVQLGDGDAAAIIQEPRLTLSSQEGAHYLVFALRA